jgi:hypothetical protein
MTVTSSTPSVLGDGESARPGTTRFAGIVVANVLVLLDASILNVALPDAQRERLKRTPSGTISIPGPAPSSA